MNRTCTLAATLAVVCSASQSPGALVTSGFTVSTYANVTDPVKLSFGTDGVLYVGRDASGSGAGAADPVAIHQVAPGGGVTTYGPSVEDPDAVLFDATGSVSGVAGSILIGSGNPGATQGRIIAIRPDLTVFDVFGPTTIFLNPTDLEFDHTGRLVFTDFNGQQVLSSSGGAFPTQLFTSTTTVNGLAIGADDSIYTTGADGVIRIHSASGALIDDDFASGEFEWLDFGSGGAFGTDLYASRADGSIVRIDAAGVVTEVGSGFGQIFDLEFGPGGSLYVSSFSNDRIYAITATSVPEPSGMLLTGFAAAGGLAWRRRTRRCT
jgi:hypothetical protein